MGNAFRIGRVFGIELRIDPSWLFIFALISWSLTSLFASWHPDWPLATSVVVALIAALMFFMSVLVHELAHSLVARGVYNIPVRDITLHLFGGVSNIEKEPPTPGAELFIAIVGPITSVALGVSMLLVSALLVGWQGASDVGTAEAVVSRLGPVTTLLVWLGPVNVMVGLFNLIPGFPLDGGRILRALVWKATNSLQRATRIASGTGQAVGWFFIALGIVMALGYQVPFFGRGLSSGLWLAMIGLFLRNAAAAHLRGAAIEEALVGVHVGDLMRSDGTFVDAYVPLREVVDGWFMRHDQPAYPVFDRGHFVGIISVDDIRRVGAEGRPEDWYVKRASDAMTPRTELVTTHATEDLATALRKMGGSQIRQLPVLDEDGLLLGVLFEQDVLRWLELRGQFARRRSQAAPRIRHA